MLTTKNRTKILKLLSKAITLLQDADESPAERATASQFSKAVRKMADRSHEKEIAPFRTEYKKGDLTQAVRCFLKSWKTNKSFSSYNVERYIEKTFPKLLEHFGKSSLSSSVYLLRDEGQVTQTGSRQYLYNPTESVLGADFKPLPVKKRVVLEYCRLLVQKLDDINVDTIQTQINLIDPRIFLCYERKTVADALKVLEEEGILQCTHRAGFQSNELNHFKLASHQLASV